jgi:hypothetical protein
MLKYIVIALALMEAGWMTFDGSHALLTGDYITPKHGPGAGQLGPWTKPVLLAGLDPRSTAMKTIFVVYGGLWLGATIAFALSFHWSKPAMLLLAFASLWYLPIGTASSVIQILLLGWMMWRTPEAGSAN